MFGLSHTLSVVSSKLKSAQPPYLAVLSLGYLPYSCIRVLFLFVTMTPLCSQASLLGTDNASNGHALREHLRGEREVRSTRKTKYGTEERYFFTCK